MYCMDGYYVGTFMKNNFYLKLVVALFVAMPCFADGVDIIGKEYGERQGKFNADPLNDSAYMPHTETINGVLKEERNVVVDRAANDGEKETILKAVMASVVIHGFDASATSVFDKRSTLTAGTMLGKHFEILRLTEALAGDLMAQLSTGFMNIAALAGYDDLYGFSGKGAGVFEGWFKDVVSKHSPGLAQRITLSLQKEHNDAFRITLFGDIATHHMMGYSAVFVSTYNTASFSNCVLIHLSDRGGRQRYIVIENPNYDGGSYTIRAHPIVNGDSGDANPSANIEIKCPSATISIDDSNKSIHSHPRDYSGHIETVFSPDNKHLSGISSSPLTESEFFSFVSNVDGIGGCTTKVDTLHLITGKIDPIVELAKSSSNLGDFLQRLSRAHEIFGADTSSHLAKMMAFIVGSI